MLLAGLCQKVPVGSQGKHKKKRAAGLSEVAPLLADGLGLHQAGRLADAEKIYNQILAILEPDHFESLHLLGLISYQRGNHAEAVSQIDFALESNPNDIFALNNRGIALKELKRFEEALASYDRALAWAGSGRGALQSRPRSA